jgi:hypothetical protein
MNTLKEIQNKLQDFCDNHSQINQFEMDDFTKFASNDIKYPCMWVTPTSMRMQEGKLVFVVNVAMMDIVYDDQDLIKSLSDLAITLTELYAWLTDDADNERYFISLIDISDAQPFFRGVDSVCGWQIDVAFTIGHSYAAGAIRFK